jgi:hypothetical protein
MTLADPWTPGRLSSAFKFEAAVSGDCLKRAVGGPVPTAVASGGGSFTWPPERATLLLLSSLSLRICCPWAAPWTPNGGTALCAAGEGSVGVLRALLGAGSDSNRANALGATLANPAASDFVRHGWTARGLAAAVRSHCGHC